jgi:hypothetical protein
MVSAFRLHEIMTLIIVVYDIMERRVDQLSPLAKLTPLSPMSCTAHAALNCWSNAATFSSSWMHYCLHTPPSLQLIIKTSWTKRKRRQKNMHHQHSLCIDHQHPASRPLTPEMTAKAASDLSSTSRSEERAHLRTTFQRSNPKPKGKKG